MASLSRLSSLPSLLRISLFVVALLATWIPYALIAATQLSDSIPRNIALTLGFYGMFLGWLWFWGRRVYQFPRVFWHYGLRGQWQTWHDIGVGLGVGLGLIALLFGVQHLLGWVQWHSSSAPVATLLWQGALLGIGVAIAEELLFRGWLLDEFQRDYALTRAIWSHAIVFAILHFLKPLSEILRTLPQLLGLVLLGVVLAHAKNRTGQLGLSIGLHAGLVWGYYLADVGDWVAYTNMVPQWVTGINQNPLAGVIGLSFMVVLLIGIQRIGKSKINPQV
jgi:hypothetical protein